MVHDLGWRDLKDRRRDLRLSLLYKIVTDGHVAINPDHPLILPSIPPAAIKDQFAFKPTGSTTCALVYFMHHVIKLLETNS